MIGRNYPNLELLPQRPATVGKVFFVDSGTGAANNEGTDPANPLNTVTEAVDHCTNSKGDCIIVMQNSPSSPPSAETFPVVIDKAGVLLTGIYSRGLLSDSGFGSDEQNVATIQIKANYVTVESLYLGCDNLGSTGGIVENYSSTSYYSTTFRNVLFDTQYVAAYGIYFTADMPYMLIEDCQFGRADVAGFSTANIYVTHTTVGVIRRCLFTVITANAISLSASCGMCSILDNTFLTQDARNGEAITIANGATNNLIVGNRAVNGMLSNAYSFNPYRDLSSNTSNHWALNYMGNQLREPVGS